MSLATRCTSCGTVFRVVQDQLKVSEGWVRCGRCDAVFNALEGLFDLDREAPPAWPAPTVPVPAALADAHPAAHADAIDEVDIAITIAPEPLAAEALPPERTDAQWPTPPSDPSPASTPAALDEARDPFTIANAAIEPEPAMSPSITASSDALEAVSSASEPSESAVAPDFMRYAQRQARSRSPQARALRAGVAALLAAGLMLQVLHHARDTVAARWPAAAPALAAWCSLLACRLELPRRIDDIAVESTALTRATSADAFRLSINLRNRGGTALAVPSVDLSLTDTNGQLLARRILAPREFRSAPALLKPGAESTLQLLLNAGAARVTGYTVEVFYP